MANDILGSELNIDGLIEAADKAQKAMDKVADSAEGAGKKISDVFKSISTQGIDYTLQKLYDLKATYESISKVEVKDAGLKEIATNAKTALDEVNKLIEGLSKAYGAKAPTSTTAQQKAEENRYNEWLRQKHKEEQIHKQIEDRKTQATRSAIAEQNQAYADANAKKQSIARDNDNVKINSEVARKAYEEQLRMYENLFAQAEKKRPDLIDVAKTRTDINAIDSQLDKLMDRINRLNNEMQLFKSMESGKTLKTEDYAHIGKVSDELNKLMAQYEALDKLKTAMSSKSGFEQAIADLSGVSLQAQRSKQALDDLAQSYRTGTSAFHQQMKTPEFALDFSKNAKSIEEERQAIQLLKQARESLDKTTPDGKKKVQELTDAIANHEKNLKRATQSTQEYNDAQRKLASKRLEHIYSVSPNLALNYSKQAKSINEQILAIKRLKSARDNLNRGSFASEEAYRKKVQELNNEIKRQQTEVDKLTNKNKSLSNSHRSLMDTAGQLTRKLALLFSVSAIQGYFNKLVSIRGEFELQAKSLEVLLQNKDEANKLWNQTVQLAVKSPFTVKELVTYTKQLAAYRIESDKLYETNKMLADVSAGLGVDMNRLILAYGQVKAANFLRGTELRQFSEAGVNMLDELAKRFTALEGRAVSVGDVFERVSKRMVSFADVEAVFKTITSEGGTFYNMQEKQAETLRGMVSNLKDQIDLMLNDVGMRNEGFLKGLMSLTVTLVKNWRDIVPLINMVSGILITRFLQKGMVGILRMTKGVLPLLNSWKLALQGATTQAQALGTAMNGITKANAWIALIGLVVTLGYAIYDAATSASKLQEELGRIDADLTQRLEESISGYISLAKTATDANKSMEEQKEAVAKLNSAYDDILPQYMLTHDYLQQLNGDYKEVTDAIRLYYETQAIEQKKAKIKDNYSEDINTDTVDLISDIKNQIKDSDLGQDLKDYLLASVSGAVHATLRDVEQGKIASNTKAITEAIFSAMAQGTELSSDALIKALRGVIVRNLEGSVLTYSWSSGYIGKNIHELATSFRDLNRELEGLEGLPDLENKIPLADKEGYEKTKEAYDLMNGLMNEYVNFVNKYVGKENVAWELLTPTINTENLEKLKTLYPQLVPILQEFYTQLQRAANGQVQFAQSLPLIKSTVVESFGAIVNNANTASNAIRDFGKVGITAGHDFSRILADADITNLTNPMQKALTQGNTAVRNFVEKANNDINKLQFNKVGTEIFNAMKQISQTQGVDLDVFAKIIPSANQSLDEYKRKVKEYLETLQEVQKTVNSTMITESFKKESLAGVNMDSVEELDATTKAVKMLADMIGVVFKSISGRSRRNNPAKDFANVLQEMFREYEKMNDKFSKEESKNRIARYFKETFEEASRQVKGFKLQLEDFDFTTFDGVINALSSLKKFAQDRKTSLAIQREIDKLESERDTTAIDKAIEKREREIELLIEEYNLYKDLESKGMGELVNFLGVEPMDLDKLTEKVTKLYGDINSLGEEEAKAFQNTMDKINKLQDEQLKKFMTHLEKTLDQVTVIQAQYASKISLADKMFDLGKIDTDQYVAVITNSITQMRDEMGKVNFDKYKQSTEYIRLMGRYLFDSNKELQKMKTNLQNVLKNTKNLSQEQIKEIQDGIKKINKQTEKNNKKGFTMFGFIDDIKKIKDLQKDISDEQKNYDSLDKQRQQLLREETVLTNQLNLNEEERNRLRKEGLDTTSLDTTIDLQQKGLEVNKQQMGEVQGMMQNSSMNLQQMGQQMQEMTQGAGSAIAIIDMIIKGVYQGIKATIQLFNELKDLADSMGTDTEVGSWRKASNAFDIIGEFNEHAMAGWEKLKNQDGLGATVEVLSSILSLWTGINKAVDDDKEERIKNRLKQVADLERAYKRLEDQIEDIYTAAQAQSAFKQANKNIEDQIANYDAMLEQEKAKKNPDEERIKEWEDAIYDLKQQQKELNEEFIESLGSTYDYRSAAREFADAWIEAFKETGNGLKGLQDHFKEFFFNMLLEQAVLNDGSKILQPLITAINKALENDFQITSEELPQIEREGENAINRFHAFMDSIFGQNGIFNKYLPDEGSSLSGLQEGIQGITEETAQIIEAYLNSIRFYVAQDNQNLTDLRNFFIGSEDNVNPMLAQLKIIATQTTAIKSLLESLTAPHPTQSGRGLKVII